jgi:20S proteasome alpha/beta subunit
MNWKRLLIRWSDPLISIGSGSTYVYGYCDATYKDDFTEEQTVEFVKNSQSFFSSLTYCLHSLRTFLILVIDSSGTRYEP